MMARGRTRQDASDAGFSLIEVIAALAIIGIVATAALYFFITGTKSSSHLQRTQNAVALANEAIERAYSIEPRPGPGQHYSRLADGRTEADVLAAWAYAESLGVEGLDQMYPLWDTDAGPSDTPAVPIQVEKTQSRMEYTLTVLIGQCYRSTASVDQDCVRLTSISELPLPDAVTPPAGQNALVRITAIVSWQATMGECPGGTCVYSVSGFADPTHDLEWNQVFTPLAVPDFEAAEQGQEIPIHVMFNDIIGPVGSNPVQITRHPSPGEGTVTTAPNGWVTYTAPAWGSGLYTFDYRIRDARGAWSDSTTVEVAVTPKVTNDSYYVFQGTSVFDVLANDNGTPAELEIVDPPSNGTAVVSGLEVHYTPTVENGLDSFRYRYTDGYGQVSEEATVQISIDNLTVQDHTAEIPARSTTNSNTPFHDLTETLLGTNTNPDTIRVTIVGERPEASNVLRLGGSIFYNSTGSTSESSPAAQVEYRPRQNVVGEYTFQYRLSRVGGEPTAVRTVTVRVLPVATDDTLPSANANAGYAHNGTRILLVGTNDAPTTFTATTAATITAANVTISANCGNLHATQNQLANGGLRVTMPNLPTGTASRNCTLTYRITGAGALSHLQSETVTVTYRILRSGGTT